MLFYQMDNIMDLVGNRDVSTSRTKDQEIEHELVQICNEKEKITSLKIVHLE